nr:RecName: Full=Putative neurotoxin [Rhopalurus junceus]
KEGYPKNSEGCKITCLFNDPYCKGLCINLSTQADY